MIHFHSRMIHLPNIIRFRVIDF